MSDKNKVFFLKLLIAPTIVVIIGIFIFFKIVDSKKIKEIRISDNYVKLTVGEQYIVKYSIIPSSAKDEALRWQTDNENVITIDHGVITANSIGDAVVWVSPLNNLEQKTSFKVNVATKKNRFKQKLVEAFNYLKQEDTDVFTSKGYVIDMNEHIFYMNDYDTIYTYYYMNGEIYATYNSKGSFNQVKYTVADEQFYCYSNESNWCEKGMESRYEKIKTLYTMFKNYLGSDISISDLE